MLPPVKKTKYRFLALMGFMTIAAAVYICFFSPLLEIKNVQIEGLQEARALYVENVGANCATNADYIKKTILDLISKRRVLLGLIPSDNLMLAEKSWFLKLQTPDIKNFFIEKNFIKRTLSVYFEPRKEILSWCRPKIKNAEFELLIPENQEENKEESQKQNIEEWECFYADKDGALFKKSSFIELPHFIQIKDFAGRQLALGDSVDSKIINFAQNIFLNTKNKNFPLSRFEIENYESKEINGDGESFKILFSLKKDPARQIDNLFAVLKQEIKDNQSRLLYVDLRNDNKVFFKYR